MSEVEYYEEAIMNVAKRLVKLSDELIQVISSNKAIRDKIRREQLLDELCPSTAKLRREVKNE